MLSPSFWKMLLFDYDVHTKDIQRLERDQKFDWVRKYIVLISHTDRQENKYSMIVLLGLIVTYTLVDDDDCCVRRCP
jgi:hypothetical protein